MSKRSKKEPIALTIDWSHLQLSVPPKIRFLGREVESIQLVNDNTKRTAGFSIDDQGNLDLSGNIFIIRVNFADKTIEPNFALVSPNKE